MFKKNFLMIFFILFLSIFIVGFDFFSLNGTYFLLDEVFYPIYTNKSFFKTGIFWHIHDFLIMVFGYIFFSKILFFSIIFFTGFLGYKLASLFYVFFKIKERYNFLSFYFIMFLTINPFFYERMITQSSIFLGIIFIGYGLYFLLKNIIIINKKQNYIYSGILFGLSFSLMNHAIFMVFTIYFLYVLFFIRNKKNFMYIIISFIVFIVLNINWLIGNFFLNKGNTLNYLHLINQLNQLNIDNFTSNSLNPLGVELTSLLLYGFWGERYNHFILPQVINPNWYIAGLFIFIIILYGFILFLKNIEKRKIGFFLFFLGIISYILGVGVVAKWGFISKFLYDNVPFYIGLREPHKWIGILMVIYSIFFSFGTYNIGLILDKLFNMNYINVFIIFLLLNARTPTILFSFHGQLFITDYPKEYFEFLKKEKLKNTSKNKYLILPWHSYIACIRTKGRVISNTISQFMSPINTVTADNIEIGTLYTNSQSKQSKDIEQFLNNLDIGLLKKNNFTHIIMLENCADFKRYNNILSNLEKNNILEKEYISKELTSYKIK